MSAIVLAICAEVCYNQSVKIFTCVLYDKEEVPWQGMYRTR